MIRTRLENLVFEHPDMTILHMNAEKQEKQEVIDSITPEIMQQVTTDELLKHNDHVYNATVDEYASGTHNKGIVDHLIPFMENLEDGSRVLDVGCGPGRDSLFMAVPDPEYRKSNMTRETNGLTTLQRYPWPPTNAFRVLGVDRSNKMVGHARAKRQELAINRLFDPKSHPYMQVDFTVADMHRLDDLQVRAHMPPFDAVWSNAALFTHTPVQLFLPALRSVSNLLRSGGVFCVNYTNGGADGVYDKLLLSSTGRIKYFSHPFPGELKKIAKYNSLLELDRSYSDYVVEGEVVKRDLFVSQTFVRI